MPSKHTMWFVSNHQLSFLGTILFGGRLSCARLFFLHWSPCFTDNLSTAWKSGLQVHYHRGYWCTYASQFTIDDIGDTNSVRRLCVCLCVSVWVRHIHIRSVLIKGFKGIVKGDVGRCVHDGATGSRLFIKDSQYQENGVRQGGSWFLIKRYAFIFSLYWLDDLHNCFIQDVGKTERNLNAAVVVYILQLEPLQKVSAQLANV